MLLGGLPVLSLGVTMGGIATWEVVNATVNAVGLMLALGAMSALLATASRRVLAPVLVTLAWGWLAFFVLPSLYVFAHSQRFLAWSDPTWVVRWVRQIGFTGVVLHIVSTGHATDGVGGQEFVTSTHRLTVDGREVLRWRRPGWQF